MKLFTPAKKHKSWLYVAIVSNSKETFVKAGVSCFPELKYDEFVYSGYSCNEIERFRFDKITDAGRALKKFKDQHAEHIYIPLHEFPENDFCFSREIIGDSYDKDEEVKPEPVQEVINKPNPVKKDEKIHQINLNRETYRLRYD